MGSEASKFDSIKDTYDVYEEIGEGGGGTVYRAYHKRLQKQIVIKQIHDKLKGRVNNRAEVDILKTVRSPYLPQVFDIIEIDGSVFTVMDYISGRSFEQWISEGIRFSQKDILRWAKQLLEAITLLHGQNPPIIHTDIKPDNLMLTDEGNICLIDFNISSYSSDGKAIAVGFSEGYSPPEQYPKKCREEDRNHDADVMELASSNGGTMWFKYGEVDIRSDIYSIGATLYYLLTGVRPGRSIEGVVPISQLSDPVSEGFQYIIEKTMKYEPERRYQTASQMTKALNRIHKSDRRYKRFVLLQEITIIAFTIMFGASILTVNMGIRKMGQEEVKLYDTYIDQIERKREEGDLEGVKKLYQEAVSLKAYELEAYYQMALSYYEAGLYQDDISFINEYVRFDQILREESGADRIYFILANCYFNLEDYPSSVAQFSKAISLNHKNSEYYRDYAISLCRIGSVDEASKILLRAAEQDVADSDIDLVQGEIDYTQGDYEGAAGKFMECIGHTDDHYVRMRAYVMASKCYKEMKDYPQQIRTLTEAKELLPPEQHVNILERLAQAYIDYGTAVPGTDAYPCAIQILRETEEMGWDTYNTHHNIAILYQKTSEYDKAYQELLMMQEEYGENYNTEKRLAFLEVDRQSKQPVASRNYQTFQVYYDRATALYQNQPKKSGNDMEMQVLEQLYQEIKSGDWL